MFTGIVEEVGSIRAIKRGNKMISLDIEANQVLEGIKTGDSIATNGVCLTATKIYDKGFVADVMPETMKRTNLGHLNVGSQVNLERALKLSDRLNGHYVTGHVDCVGKIAKKFQQGDAWIIEVRLDDRYLKYVIPQGSITLDGISLTIVKVVGAVITVSIIPHTGKETTLIKQRAGGHINIECDHISKYVEQLLRLQERSNVNYESY